MYGDYITGSNMIAIVFMCYDIYPGIADGEMNNNIR
jgi:hypothetical protein